MAKKRVATKKAAPKKSKLQEVAERLVNRFDEEQTNLSDELCSEAKELVAELAKAAGVKRKARRFTFEFNSYVSVECPAGYDAEYEGTWPDGWELALIDKKTKRPIDGAKIGFVDVTDTNLED